MTKNTFLEGMDVSRETRERLKVYERLLTGWNPKINLVSPSTLPDLWARHFTDSAQLLKLAPEDARTWTDLGSGGGFPGLVIAILAHGTDKPLDITLIESDQRKCAFLRTVLRETGITVTVTARRIEDARPGDSDVVSARALAPLDRLLGLVARHLGATGTALLPKGANWRNELAKARESWHFSCHANSSLTDRDAVVLQIGDLSHV